MKCFAEWAGWDILLVYPEGFQLGIQAKLRLNAEVILQAGPGNYDDGDVGPDYRAVLVPDRNGWAAVASRLGLVVFSPIESFGDELDFSPGLRPPRFGGPKASPDEDWTDWNPAKRHKLPPVESTDSVAGSSCPVTLTTWKLGALAVLAELQTRGTITTKRIRAIGIDPHRWTQSCWLLPGEKRGDWVRGDKCPPFDKQHPTAFAAALAAIQAGEGERGGLH